MVASFYGISFQEAKNRTNAPIPNGRAENTTALEPSVV